MRESDLSISKLELFLSATVSLYYFNGFSYDSFNSALSMQIADKITNLRLKIKF